MEVGGVKWGVYSYYATSVGILATLAIIAFYLGFQGFQVEIVLFLPRDDYPWQVGSSIWLSQWVDDPLARLISMIFKSNISFLHFINFLPEARKTL